MKRYLTCIFLCVGCLLLLVEYGLAANQGVDVSVAKRYKLYPGKKGDPYSLVIPLELSHTGRIRLSMSVELITPKKVKLLSHKGAYRLWVLDPGYKNSDSKNKVPKAYILKEKIFFNPAKNYLDYYVDDPELERLNGKYELMISNLTNGTVVGEYFLIYPGSVEDSRKSDANSSRRLPDLVVSGISLSRNKDVVVTVKNIGRKGVPNAAWSKNKGAACSLSLKIGGKYWGGVALKLLDPHKNLQEIGGTAKYSFPCKVSGNTRVEAVINENGPVTEINKENNSLVKVLKPFIPSDLSISRINLNRKNQVVVTVTNSGKTRLPVEIWSHGGARACTLSLVIDGKAWGGATLKGLDPQKKLLKPGGSVRYVSKYTVTKKTRVTAFIDALGQVTEENENNNRLAMVVGPSK